MTRACVLVNKYKFPAIGQINVLKLDLILKKFQFEAFKFDGID